jgi:carboxypeptidase D
MKGDANVPVFPDKRRRDFRTLLWSVLLGASLVGIAQSQPATPTGSGKGAGPRAGVITKVAVVVTNHVDVDRLVRAGYDVDDVHANTVVLYADDDELKSLSSDGWKFSVITPAEAASGSPRPKVLGDYNDYAAITAMLDSYATNYPAICRKVSIGKSVQNRDLWVVKITTDPDVHADKPKFKYISTMHANEPLGTEMCLYLIDLLLSGYTNNDARIVNLVSNAEIWILPLMNPDGREINPPQRYNANGYDLNRSFPEGSSANLGNLLYGPPLNTNGLQPEVSAVMSWTVGHHFSLGANFHTGALVVNYPYDNDNLGSAFSPTPDEALMQILSRTYSSNNLPMWNSPYFANGIVNGAAWYAISGGMQDWNYRYVGCVDLTIELSDDQWPDPPASEIGTYWIQNRESMLAYMEWSLRGVRGIIRDARTGQPVAASVRVDGYPHQVFSDPTVGDYHRTLPPGIYSLLLDAPGYIPRRISNVIVTDGPATRLDVALEPASTRFAAQINFQPVATIIPAGFSPDSGAAFGPRPGGYAYGWETNLSAWNSAERGAGCSQDLRYDTLCQMQVGGNHVWEIAVPPGPYSVLVVAGDPLFTNGLYRISVENVPLLDGVPTATNRWVEALDTVIVTDGRLTISNGAGAVSNRLAFLEINAVEPSTIEQWRALYFGVTNNVGPAADDADPDGDSIPNLLEYAFGLSPAVSDALSLLSPFVIQTNAVGRFGCSFLRNTNATDLVFSVQAGRALSPQSWLNVAVYSNGVGWTGPGEVYEQPGPFNSARVTVFDPEPIAAGTNRFMRLRVSHP